MFREDRLRRVSSSNKFPYSYPSSSRCNNRARILSRRMDLSVRVIEIRSSIFYSKLRHETQNHSRGKHEAPAVSSRTNSSPSPNHAVLPVKTTTSPCLADTRRRGNVQHHRGRLVTRHGVQIKVSSEDVASKKRSRISFPRRFRFHGESSTRRDGRTSRRDTERSVSGRSKRETMIH